MKYSPKIEIESRLRLFGIRYLHPSDGQKTLFPVKVF